jgi:Leucine-rich repeat (LRR) protein
MKHNYLNKKILLFTSSLFFNLVILFSQSTMAQQAETNDFKTFEDWCKNKDSLAENVKHTINVLLEKARTSDCSFANSKLSNARFINLNGNAISNLLPLSSFINLTKLDLNNNKVVDIQPLEKLTNLTELSISDNYIYDLSPLKNMKDLTYLAVKRNQISDVSPLQNLTNLQRLFLDDNKITDIMSLQSLKKLNAATFRRNPIIKKVCPVKSTVYMPRCSF